jgi:hypothetical protein
MAIELRNRIEADLDARVPIVAFLQGVSIRALDELVLAELDGEAPAPPRADRLEPALIDARRAEELLAEVDALPDADVDALLTTLLEGGDGRP